MNEECIICQAPLEYLENDIPMECSVCHKKIMARTRCVKGHFVCDECHTEGVGDILSICLKETSKNPIEIMETLMSQPFCHMHGPEHHVMVGASLLAAYKNAGGSLDLEQALIRMTDRGREVPGGVCGFWGACGAGISCGIFISIVTGSTPLENGPWGLSNMMTSAALAKIGAVGGPRCCKRDSYLAILAAAEFVKEHLHVEMETTPAVCSRSSYNNQCIGKRCPFSPLNQGDGLTHILHAD